MPNNDKKKENQQDMNLQAMYDQLAAEGEAENIEKQKLLGQDLNKPIDQAELDREVEDLAQEMHIPEAPAKAPEKEKTLDDEVEALQQQIDAEQKAEPAPKKELSHEDIMAGLQQVIDNEKKAQAPAPAPKKELSHEDIMAGLQQVIDNEKKAGRLPEEEPEVSDLDKARVEDGAVDENGEVQPLTASDRVQILLQDSLARAASPNASPMDRQEYVAIRTLNEILTKPGDLDWSDGQVAMECARLMTLAERLRNEKRNQIFDSKGPLAQKLDGLTPPEIREYCRGDKENSARTAFTLRSMTPVNVLTKKVLWRFLSEDGAKTASILVPKKKEAPQAEAPKAEAPKGPVRQPLYQPAPVKKKPVAQTYEKTGSDLRKLCEDMRNAHSIFGKEPFDNVEKALNQVSKDWDSNAAARNPKKARDDMQRVMELSAIYLAGKAKDHDKLTGVAKQRFDAVSNVMKMMNKQIGQLNRVLAKQEKAAKKPEPAKAQNPVMKM